MPLLQSPDKILSFCACNFFLVLTELAPKYFLSNELFWKRVVGILTNILQHAELEDGHLNGLTHIWKLLYVPFHRFSKNQNKQTRHIELLYHVILEIYSPMLFSLSIHKVNKSSFLLLSQRRKFLNFAKLSFLI